MVKEKISFSELKIELGLWVLAVILTIISLTPWFYRNAIGYYLWYGSITLSAIIVFRVVVLWARKNRDKIKGHIFELFFFIFLFLATYTLTFIVQSWMVEIMGIGFIFGLIGAAYCGWLHYREGIFTENYWKPSDKKKK